ncbi:hypothetical protein ACFFLM_06700 [Deinococcus oregonensis]|uniref:Uncharacterized protein n=1 Tax=Deinococcus oregonensis TaxID=1805970 RepID=A0ABV6AVX4_9DEIO
MPHVFKRVQVSEDGQAVHWPGGFVLPVSMLVLRRHPRWLIHLGVVPSAERYRPLLPLLRYTTPGVALLTQPARHHLMQMFVLRSGELQAILDAYPVPEDVMLHRLHDIGLFLQHHLHSESPVALLRRPWPYAAYRCPKESHLHTLVSCLTWGRLDLVEEPLWALARAEVAG